MAFRFLHTADIHLDSPLKSLALRNPEVSELIGNATRGAFVSTIDLCLSEQVDALLLSGDLYDGDQTSMKTARFLAEQIHRLDEAGIRVFIIRGNHDALSKITKELSLPDSVKVFGSRAEAISIGPKDSGKPITIHGLSFAQPHAPESLLAKYKVREESSINIGLMHTSLAGAAGHDKYAPCSVSDLQATEFDYWALGHIHKRSLTSGPCTILMSGMPQGRDINEAGPKSVSIVAIANDGKIQIDERVTSIAQFERITIDLSGVNEWKQMVKLVKTKLEAIRETTTSKQLVARLSLIGETVLAWQLRRDTDLLKSEADNLAAILGRTWIEKVDVSCTPGSLTNTPPGDPLFELRALVGNDVIESEAYQSAIMTIADELRAQLPSEIRNSLGTNEGDYLAKLNELSREGLDDVLATLQPHAPEQVE